MVFTVGTAAKAVGKSKSTISKAIQKGRISAARKSDGSYEIQPVELFRVYPKVEPGQPAAKAVGKPKSTILGRMSAARKPDGSYEIRFHRDEGAT